MSGGRRPARKRARVCGSLLVPAVASVLASAGGGCRDNPPAPNPSTAAQVRPNASTPYSLIWLSLDTLRADHLGLYGYDRPTSPFIDELAKKGLYFEWTISPANSTLPSHMTMFTGHHPAVHQLMHSRQNPGLCLSPAARTLPQVLHAAGYQTLAWTDGAMMAAYYGYARGFEQYRDKTLDPRLKIQAMLHALDRRNPDKPFFYFLHTYQVHAPYHAPPPYDTRFKSPEPRDEAARSMDIYDGAIAYLDDEIRKLVGELERRALLDHTILVITADHGESFNEYQIAEIGHEGDNLHQNVTRVPWIILHPDAAYRARRVRGPVGLVDFANTMLALLGRDERMDGDGVNVLDPSQVDAVRPYVSMTGKAWSLYHGEHHLLYSEEYGGPRRNGVFNVVQDPREQSPLADAALRDALIAVLKRERERLEGLSRELTSALRATGTVPEDVRNDLRRLGYLN